MSKTKYSDSNVVGTSLLVSVSDVVLNLLVGLFTGSTVIIAQSLQGLSDLITASILFIGVKRSKKKADKKHPLGYGREIFFWVLLASVLMFMGTGLYTSYMGINQIINPGEITNIGIGYIMLTFGLVTNYYAFRKSNIRLRGRKRKSIWVVFRSSPLIETKATFIVDFLGTISAAFGLVAITAYLLTGNVQFDGLGSVLVGSTMMIAAVVLVLDVRDLIVGKSVPDDINRKIRSTTLKHKEVEEILDLRTLYLGSEKIMVLLEVHLNENMNTNGIEHLLDEIRLSIKKDIPQAYHLQIEVETPDDELVKSI
jgi:cation diffusion facilitator family transporter